MFNIFSVLNPVENRMDIQTSIEKLSSDDSLDREEGQNELIAIGEPAVPALLHIAAGQDSRSFYAAHALGVLKRPEAVAILRPLLASDDEGLRGIAAFALVDCGYDNTVELMAWLDAGDWRIRSSAVLLLEILRHISAIPALLPLLDDPHELVRWRVGHALEVFKTVEIY
jgi:HEAT repeat protein